MGSVVFACLAPHGWLAVPLLCGPEGALARTTQEGMRELARRLEAARPDTVVVVTPHGTQVEGMVSLLNTPVVRGDSAGLTFGERRHGFRVEFEVDSALNAAIMDAAQARDVPVARVTNHAAWEPLWLDFGSLIPLWCLAAGLAPPPKVVVACADRGERAVPFEASYRLGKAVADAARVGDARVVVVCSGDLGHGHLAEGPYGFHAESAEFDRAVAEAIQKDDLGGLLSFDRAWVTAAKTDAFGPLLTLHGVTESVGLTAERLCYEAPTYFGMACAAYGPKEAVG